MVDLSKSNALMLFGVLLVIAAVAMAFSVSDSRIEEGSVAGDASNAVRRNVRLSREPRESRDLLPADVVNMTPKDWSGWFRKFPSGIPSPDEQEILLLADELQELLRKNPDPKAAEAVIISDAILTLLAEGDSPE